MTMVTMEILTDTHCWPGALDLPDGPALIGDIEIGRTPYTVVASGDEDGWLSIQVTDADTGEIGYQLRYRPARIRQLRRRLENLPIEIRDRSSLQQHYGFRRI